MEKFTVRQLLDRVELLPTAENDKSTDIENIVKWVPIIDPRLTTRVGREQYGRFGNYKPVSVMFGRQEIARLLIPSTIQPNRMTIDSLEKEIIRSLRAILEKGN